MPSPTELEIMLNSAPNELNETESLRWEQKMALAYAQEISTLENEQVQTETMEIILLEYQIRTIREVLLSKTGEHKQVEIVELLAERAATAPFKLKLIELATNAQTRKVYQEYRKKMSRIADVIYTNTNVGSQRMNAFYAEVKLM